MKMAGLLFLLLLSGCVTAPVAYRPAKDAQSEGYFDTKIQDGVYSIQFRGKPETNMQRIMDFALLRAAERASADGYRYFTVLTEKSDSKTVTDSMPEQEPVGCIGRHCFPTFYTVWETYSYKIPGIYFMVQAYKEKPANVNATVFDAEQVKENVRKQYGLVPAIPPPGVKAAKGETK